MTAGAPTGHAETARYPDMAGYDEARTAGERTERLLEQLRTGPDPRAAMIGEDLVRCLVQLYGAALASVVEAVGPERTLDLCADPLVESLVLVHDLHPLDTGTRIRRCLDRIPRSTAESSTAGSTPTARRTSG